VKKPLRDGAEISEEGEGAYGFLISCRMAKQKRIVPWSPIGRKKKGGKGGGGGVVWGGRSRCFKG